jgi:hypothetical protein
VHPSCFCALVFSIYHLPLSYERNALSERDLVGIGRDAWAKGRPEIISAQQIEQIAMLAGEKDIQSLHDFRKLSNSRPGGIFL